MLVWYQSNVIKLNFTESDTTPIKFGLLMGLHYDVLSQTDALCDVIFIRRAWLPSCLELNSRVLCVQEWGKYFVSTCWDEWDGNVFQIYWQCWNRIWVAEMGKLNSGQSLMGTPRGAEPKTISEMLLLMPDGGLCVALCLWFHITQYRWEKKGLSFLSDRGSCKCLSWSLVLLWRSRAVSF